MSYRIIYSKPKSDGYPMIAHAAQREEAMEKARMLERVGYMVDVWEDSETCSRQIAPSALTFRDVVAASGMSCRKVAERFSIPYRTAEDWASGKRKPPAYVLLMMQEALGI